MTSTTLPGAERTSHDPRLIELPGVADSREAAFPWIVAEMNARGLVGVCDYEFTGSSREVFVQLTAVRPLATFLESELVAER